MRSEPHPFSGFMYHEVGDGTVRVEDQQSGRYGLFKANGTWLEGEITYADPCMLDLIGAPDVADGWNVYWSILPVELDMDNAPLNQPGQVQEVAKAEKAAKRHVGPYVPDPGKQTADGMRSVADIDQDFLLRNDRHPERIPPSFWAKSPPPGGPQQIPVERFYTREYHDLETERLWKKCWQMVCREDDIPNIGDYHHYEISRLSFLIVRTGEREFKAHYNVCPHRGRPFRDCSGKNATEFRCPFHGWTWSIDGKVKHITTEWDFPGVREKVSQLRGAKVATWGGFIFINPDPDAAPLEEFMGPQMMAQYEKYRLEDRYKQVHVSKIIRANWKTTMEAFMEAYHVVAAHPQLLLNGLDYGDSHYDVFGNWGRLGHVMSCTSAMRGMYITPEQALQNYRNYADMIGTFLKSAIGDEADAYSDAELADTSYSNLFPNFSPWGGFMRLVYRWRPNGDNPEETIMEIMFLAPWPKGKPKPPSVPVHHLGPDEPWTTAHELGQFARIMDQDLVNLAKIQAGIKYKDPPYNWYSSYQEGVIRNWHKIYDRFLGIERGPGPDETPGS